MSGGGDPKGVRQVLTQLAGVSPAFELLTSASMLKHWGLSVGGQLPTTEYLCMMKVLDQSAVEKLSTEDLWVWGLDAG